MNDEKKRIGNEIKIFLTVNGIDRGAFAERSGLGKSTVDKLLTGIYSEKTLAKVLQKTSFKLRTLYAAKKLGSYSKINWEGYIRKYLLLHPSIHVLGSIEARLGSIDWNDTIPGLVLRQHLPGQRETEEIGVLWIPHERSPLIYIQPMDSIGVRLIVSTMVGEACMRGLAFTQQNVVANAWVPVALPVVLKRLDLGQELRPDELGQIDPAHAKYATYDGELKTVIEREYGRLVSWGHEFVQPKKRLKQ